MAGDPLADRVGAHHLWLAVAGGVPRRLGGLRGRGPGGLQQLQGGLRGQRRRPARRGRRRSPPNSPAAATASSGTGTSPIRTAHGCGKSRRSPRSCSTASRCRTKCCGRTANGSGWPRSATRTNTSAWGTHVFEIRYTIPGVLDPGTTGTDKAFATRRGRPSTAPSVFFWNVIAPSWNNRIDERDITVTLPAASPARSARSATARAGMPRP